MERRLFIETLGLLTKLEQVVSLNQHTQPSNLVLEITQPYPGYYSVHEVDKDTPRTIFLITKEAYSIEHILRLGYEACKSLKHQLDLTPCRVSIFADSYKGIRVKHLKDFEMLKQLQEFLKNEGIAFAKHRAINEEASIEIQKLFCIEEIVDGIYQDLDEPGERYVTLASKLSFGQFVKVSRAVKNNLDFSGFDAAQAVFYRKKGIVDAVRIFDPNISLHALEKIRATYEDQTKRFLLNEMV
jgi:hypothetical protein